MRSKPIGRHAAGLALVALVALATSALGADAFRTPAGAAQPGPTSADVSQVEAAILGGADPSTIAGPLALGPLGLTTEVPAWQDYRAASIPPTPQPTATPKPPAPKPAPPKPAAPKATSTSSALWWTVYHGVNHVWMPTLGTSNAVYLYPCSASFALANLVYRWGCAGWNNVYLMGHAYGVFHALYDAYYNGELVKGMPVVYADASGHVHLYRVTTWRVVSPSDSAWAIASQPVPSMTLQTCIGSNGSLRLNVRLVIATR